MNIKKNDTVLVITGKDSGKTAKVLVAQPKSNKVVVDGINVQKKHKKARSAQEVSSIVNQSGAIDASNVMVVCPTCNKATRVASNVVNGKKVRICKKCGASLDAVKEVKKEAKKATKTTKTATKTTSKAKTKKETPAEVAEEK